MNAPQRQIHNIFIINPRIEKMKVIKKYLMRDHNLKGRPIVDQIYEKERAT